MPLSARAQAHVEAFDVPVQEPAKDTVIFFAVQQNEVLELAAGRLPEEVIARARCCRDWDLMLIRNARKPDTAQSAPSKPIKARKRA